MNDDYENVDVSNAGQLRDLAAELLVSKERLLRAIASVGTDRRPIAAYLYEEAVEFGADADEIAATGRRSMAAEKVGPMWRARRA